MTLYLTTTYTTMDTQAAIITIAMIAISTICPKVKEKI